MPKLLVIRGNSASGKTTISRMLMHATRQPSAYVSQDMLRRDVLREGGEQPGFSVKLIEMVVLYALANEHNVVLDGILTRDSHAAMLRSLATKWPTRFIYLRLPFEETVRRHNTKSLASVDEDDLRQWYHPDDALVHVNERIFGPRDSAEQIVTQALEWWR